MHGVSGLLRLLVLGHVLLHQVHLTGLQSQIGFLTVAMVHVHLKGLLGSYGLHQETLNQCCAEQSAILQLEYFDALPFQIRCDVLVYHQNFGLARPNLLQHLVLIELNGADSGLSL